MKTIKFLLAAFILGLTLSSCSKQDDDDQAGTTTPIVTNPTPTTTPTVYCIYADFYNQLTPYSDAAGQTVCDYIGTSLYNFYPTENKTIFKSTTKPIMCKIFRLSGGSSSLTLEYWTETTVNGVTTKIQKGTKTYPYNTLAVNAAIQYTFNW